MGGRGSKGRRKYTKKSETAFKKLMREGVERATQIYEKSETAFKKLTGEGRPKGIRKYTKIRVFFDIKNLNLFRGAYVVKGEFLTTINKPEGFWGIFSSKEKHRLNERKMEVPADTSYALPNR